ncbi:MAG: acyltransferase [bacterium]
MNIFRKIKNFTRYVERRMHNQIDIQALVEKGLVLGENVHFDHRVIIDKSHCWLITIGDDVTFAPRASILAHDASTKNHLGYTKVGRVNIGNKTFIGSDAIVLPGTTIGENVIVAAGCVVSGNIPDGVVIAGNPAVEIFKTSDYLEKHKEKMKSRPVYPAKGFTFAGGITPENKAKMRAELTDDIGYVE